MAFLYLTTKVIHYVNHKLRLIVWRNAWHDVCIYILLSMSLATIMLLTLNCYHKYQDGYTLIELMVAIAIIGILAAIGGVTYQTQLRQSQLITVYQELNHFRVPYQASVNEEAKVIDFSPSNLSMPVQTKYCQFTVIAPIANGITIDAITCNIQNLAYLQDQTLSLDRGADGSWQCRASTGISKKYLPQACQ